MNARLFDRVAAGISMLILVVLGLVSYLQAGGDGGGHGGGGDDGAAPRNRSRRRAGAFRLTWRNSWPARVARRRIARWSGC